MSLNLKLITYECLNPKQKENYNYQKLSALLADYGFVTMRLSDDWNGADLIAHHINGETFLKIQLKSRLTFCKKYTGKNIYIAFRRKKDWYLYNHDEMLEVVDKIVKFTFTPSWKENGIQSFPTIPKPLFQILNPHQIEHSRNLQGKLEFIH